MPHPLSGKEILFTRQRHEAKKAGLHWDYRLVLGDKAYSWATKKELPEPGKSIILFEQPVHDRKYALSTRVKIPEGQYGHGVTTLDWVRKAKIDLETEEGKLVLNSGNERFLIKKLEPKKYGEKAWIFKNLSKDLNADMEKNSHMNNSNKYLTKIALNAQAAHAMAKKVGIIPDGSSQWKWALRQLRDSRGNALTGKALEIAKTKKLGAMTNTSWKKLLIAQKKHPGGELGFNVIDGKIGYIFKGKGGYAPDNKHMRKYIQDYKTPNQLMGHTHPELSKLGPGVQMELEAGMLDPDKKKELIYRLNPNFPHRIADPSGLGTIRTTEPFNKIQANKELEKAKHLVEVIPVKYNKFVEKATNILERDDNIGRHAQRVQRYNNKVNDIVRREIGRVNMNPNISGDMLTMTYLRNDRPYVIASPHLGVEALHKSTALARKPSDIEKPFLPPGTRGIPIGLQKHRRVFLQREK